jgi:hypothetical protein
MNAHLSSEQICRYMAGDCNPDMDRHIKECHRCAEEIARMRTLLDTFCSSVMEWNAHQKGAQAPDHWAPTEHKRRFAAGMMRWKLAAAALVILLAASIWKTDSDREREAKAFEADVRLLEEVNYNISQPIPSPMAPLMSLVEWKPDAIEK